MMGMAAEQVEQRLSSELQALASKQQTDQSTLAHTTTRALDAACSQWAQWREDSQATGVRRDEVEAVEARLKAQMDRMRVEWHDERSQLRTALATAKAEVSEVCRESYSFTAPPGVNRRSGVRRCRPRRSIAIAELVAPSPTSASPG